MLKKSPTLAVFLWLSLLSSFTVFSQGKRLTMEDAFLNPSLSPANLRQLTWVPGTNDYSHTNDKNDQLLRGSVRENAKVIVTATDLSAALEKAGGAKVPTVSGLEWLNATDLLVKQKGQFYRYNTQAKTAQAFYKVDAAAENLDFAPNKQRAAYTKAQNLFVSQPGAEDKQITQESNPAIVNGQAAHRSEFGITKGTFWSPSGNSLAYYRMDQTMVTDYPLVDISTVPAKLNNIKYPMAGGKSHHVTVGVYHVASGKTIFLKTGEPAEQYLTNLTWSPDEKSIYLAVVNRAQNHMWLNQYDANTGAFVKTLFEEKNDKWIEPERGLYFVPGKPDQFVWFSERDGYDHLYLYNTNGQLIRQLTKGEWIVKNLVGFDKNGREAYYTATAESPLERHFYAVELSSGRTGRLTQGSGVHNVTFSPTGQYFLDNYSSPVTPRTIRILDTDAGKVAKTLLVAPNPLQDYQLGETTIFPIKAEDGTDLYCRMITPPNFDEKKKYPVVVYVYGGPHLQMITSSWLGGSNLWMQHMAQKGYIVFSLDNRGSADRGRAFEQAIFRQAGVAEVSDQMKGVEYLKGLPYVDTNRLGVHGWSYGGFMTTSLMLKQPGVFKVGVAGGPVIDWSFYEVMYTERYMDTPQENPEGYKNANLLNHVKNLKGKLLMIHGTVDDVVVWQHSQAFLKKAVDEGVLLDYFVYPGHPHNVGGKDRVHLYKKVTEYFDEHL
ncbi:S9 family peptidase [Rufibacter glacialis]|uniref:S9 family peptidase n=1 Tax=Rufibacter glacialis TaxID=1259555 RepID=A0A5M8QU05_9BACT|nr:S9 family peptidase [Rufibacter glacialis]KAA6437672.1 S9 family peptidase [Rufibacter glacialis]GGK57315.1 prolyl tripeptidyl peptidase [Rufibacter glacialis]